MRRRLWLAVAAVLAVVPAMAGCETGGLTFSVTTTSDGVDASPGDGVCEITPGAGNCSVRAAIQEANLDPALLGRPQIELGPGATYSLSIAGSGEDEGATGDLDVLADLELVGNGATIHAKGLDRVLDVRGDVDVGLSGLTIKGGVAIEGGGLRVADAATHVLLGDSWVTANRATGSRIWQYEGAGPIRTEGEGGGGGIVNEGTLDVVRTTISANRSEGFIGCEAPRVVTCRWQGGGGLLNAATANLVDVTVAANTAELGAAIGTDPAELSSVTTIAFSTIADNPRIFGGVDPVPMRLRHGEIGRPIFGEIRIGASVLTGPSALCTRNLTSLGHNVVVDATCVAGPTDLIDTPAGLGPLADNGGQGPTLLPGSVLVDRIPAGSGCLVPIDQRGVLRPTGSGCDVGAVELEPADT